jgi:hypothetical protein
MDSSCTSTSPLEGKVIEVVKDEGNEGKDGNEKGEEVIVGSDAPTVSSSSSSPQTHVTEEPTKKEMEEETFMKSFKSICNFVKALNEVFGERSPSLQLYSHLLEKTGLIHEDPIKKHIALFKAFCKENETFILNKDYISFQSMPSGRATIQYSEKVFIDMKSLLRLADADQLETIHVHLLTILAVVDSNSKAKAVLRGMKGNKGNADAKSSSSSPTLDPEFLTNLFKKISENVNLNSENPMEMVTSLLSSGVLNDVMAMFGDGSSLDLPKILSTIQTLMSSLGGLGGLGGMGGGEGGEGLANMGNMGMIMELMKNMNNNSPSS